MVPTQYCVFDPGTSREYEPNENKPVALHRHDEVEAQRGARRQQRGTRAKNIVGIVGGPVAELAL